MFYIPPESRLDISKRNLKICVVSSYCLFIFGWTGIIFEFELPPVFYMVAVLIYFFEVLYTSHRPGDLNVPLRIQDNTIVSLSNLVSPRCYKELMTSEEAFRIIEESAGTHFDPELARIFLDSKDAVIAIMNKYQ